MLCDIIYRNSFSNSPTISETTDSLNIKFAPDKPMTELIEILFDELKSISSRDSFELFLIINGEHVKISDTSDDSHDSLIKHINDNDKDDPYEIELNITKNFSDSTISIYYIDIFSEYLISENLKNIFITFARYLNGILVFEIFSKTKNFYTNSIFFFQSGSNILKPLISEVKKRKEKIEMLKENVSFSGLELNVLPDDFNLEVKSENLLLNDFFCKAKAVLSLIFTSSSSGFTENDELTYKINGYRMVCCDAINPNALSSSCESIYKIYKWTYEGGNNIDKIGLVRNVLSIHLDNNGQIRFDNDAWEAIQSNYQIYLKENIESYLEIKNKIGELVIDSISKTYSMADDLLDSLKNNALAIITFIMTVVLVDGFKENGFTTIFSTKYLTVVAIISFLSLLWLLMIKTETENKFNYASNIIKNVLILNYSKVIMEKEINDIVTPIINENKVYLKKQIKKYTIWWCLLLGVFFSAFVVSHFMFDEKSQSSQQIELKKP